MTVSNGHTAPDAGSNGHAAAYGATTAPPRSGTGTGEATNGNLNDAHVSPADGFATRAIHVGSRPDPVTGAVVPGLHVATTYKQHGVGKHNGYEYSRSDNPTRAALEATLASLDTHGSGGGSGSGAPQGEALVFASGSAATAAIAYWAALQRKEGGGGGGDGVSGGGGHVLAVNDCYGGTARFLSRAIAPTGVEVTYLDFEHAGEEGIRAAIRDDTRVPTNPLLLVPPLPLISRIVASIPEANRPLIVVDTTFLSPFYITPLLPTPTSPPLGDIVLTSLSKYGSGHSDIILGSLTLAPHLLARRPEVLTGLRFIQNAFGGIPSPRDCHLLSRSLKTLSVRVLRHGLNALRVAAWLQTRDEVEDVKYPGLRGNGAFGLVQEIIAEGPKKELGYLGWKFPYEEEAAEDIGSIEHTRRLGIPFGGVVSFRIKGADEDGAERFMTSLRLVSLAESLGGVESLVEAPYGMTHAGLPAETKDTLGITPNLVRLSVGIEDVDDLIGDLEQALGKIRG